VLQRAQRVRNVRAQRQLLLELVDAKLRDLLLAREVLAPQRRERRVVLELPLARELLQPAVGGGDGERGRADGSECVRERGGEGGREKERK
jgi:hypothetical protein